MCVNCDDNSTTIPVGSTGEQGPQGLFGGFCGNWNFSTSTASGPSAGQLRLNSATYSSVSSIFVNETNTDSINYAAFLAAFDNGGFFGLVKIFKENDNTKFWMGEVLAVTDNGTDYSIDVSYIFHNGTFSNNDSVVICFTPAGTIPNVIQQRINTVFRQQDTSYIATTSAVLQEAGILVYHQTEFGNVIRCRVVLKGAVGNQQYTIKVTDGASNILWNTSSTLPASANIVAIDLGAVLTTPTTGLTYLKVEYNTDGTNSLRLYSIDFYNE